MDSLGERITKQRKKQGWSQEELADKIYVTRQAVSRWEKDLSQPSLENLKLLSSIFGVDIMYFIGESADGSVGTAESSCLNRAGLFRRVSLIFLTVISGILFSLAAFFAVLFSFISYLPANGVYVNGVYASLVGSVSAFELGFYISLAAMVFLSGCLLLLIWCLNTSGSVGSSKSREKME